MKSTLGIIPARFGSTRLPGKPLIKVKGKTIIERVYERVSKAKELDRVIVATDDVRIFNHVKKFGGEARMTRLDHRSGTMRCAEVAEDLPEVARVINIQGDEP
ncbi:MAG: 3-deoxy-manno-octulosonate cytidylyltransferase, partial [Saprospiraceae bacterium]|nr:3-deoxy-manno-octulosonate cytidylyltransferase [Saprospiraceae bacterium]